MQPAGVWQLSAYAHAETQSGVVAAWKVCVYPDEWDLPPPPLAPPPSAPPAPPAMPPPLMPTASPASRSVPAMAAESHDRTHRSPPAGTAQGHCDGPNVNYFYLHLIAPNGDACGSCRLSDHVYQRCRRRHHRIADPLGSGRDWNPETSTGPDLAGGYTRVAWRAARRRWKLNLTQGTIGTLPSRSGSLRPRQLVGSAAATIGAAVGAAVAAAAVVAAATAAVAAAATAAAAVGHSWRLGHQGSMHGGLRGEWSATSRGSPPSIRGRPRGMGHDHQSQVHSRHNLLDYSRYYNSDELMDYLGYCTTFQLPPPRSGRPVQAKRRMHHRPTCTTRTQRRRRLVRSC